MRTLVLLSLTLVIACGGSQKPRERFTHEQGCKMHPWRPGCGPYEPIRIEPSNTDEQAQSEPVVAPLERLSVVEPVLDGYDRKDWKHWTDEDHDCQDTRQEVLIAESQVAVTFKDARHCKVATGQWMCPYTGEIFTDPSKLDVDHMVPLGATYEAGGHEWDPARRQAYANELEAPEHLIAVKAAANRSKGKKRPDEWLPPNEGYHCQYLRDWMSIKVAWDLSITPNEKATLEAYAPRCGF